MATRDEKAATAAADEAAPAPKPAVRYRVLSGGITGVGGVVLPYDTTVTAEQIGDEERIAKLLHRGSIRKADATE